jgi:hypothetical protein
MAGTPLQKALYSGTVTAPQTTAVSLLGLIHALGGQYANVPGSSASYQIQFDPSNATNILMGDENTALSPQMCAYNAPGGGADSYSQRPPYIGPIGSLFVVAAGAGAALINFAVFQ